MERSGTEARRKTLQEFDGRLAEAAAKDLAAYFGEAMSSIAFRGRAPGVHSIRTKQVYTRFGWCVARHPYRVGNPEPSDVFKAFWVERKMTRSASSVVSRLAATLGSFKEARDTIRAFGCGSVSVSKIRGEALRVGGTYLDAERSPEKDVRIYTEPQRKVPEGGRPVPRTLVAMADGTNAPCTKKDTAGIRGKNGDEAGSRQLRVMSFCEYTAVKEDGAPAPISGSFSYAVMHGGSGELESILKVQGTARGSGTVPRMQCVADGEEALEKAMRNAFPFAEFTNDFMHASGYMNTCCQCLGIENPEKEYRTCRAIMLRHGAGSAVDRIKRLYPAKLEASEEAAAALDYLDKRRRNMKYGWLRKNGYYISSCHIEAAARILVARRCKQAGMHWRIHNAACVCALLARLRSAA